MTPSQPSPTEIPPPPAAPVTHDQFAMLVKLVQALLQLVQGLLGGLLSAASPQQLPDGTVTPVLPMVPPPNPLEATGLPRQHDHRDVEPAPRREGDKSLLRSCRARSLSPVFSRDNSTPRPRSGAIIMIRNAPHVRPTEEENQFERVRCEGLTSSDEDIKGIQYPHDMELGSSPSNEDLQGIQYPEDMEID